MEFPFAEGFNQSASNAAMNRVCTNLFPKYILEGLQGNQPVYAKYLFGTPGLNQLATTGTAASNKNRGSIVMNGVPYFVNGTALYSLSSTFTTSNLGTVLGNSLVSMAQNGTQVMVLAAGGNGYIYDINTATFSQITDPDFTANGTPIYVEFIDGYFMVVTDEKKVAISNLNDGLTWDALDFGSAETDPDATEAVINFRNQAYILGSETTEGQDNVGGADYPFLRNGIYLDKGIFARYSLVKTTNAFMFIGGGENEEPAIWMFNGSNLTKISNTGVDKLLAALSSTDLDQVASFSYAEKGDTFVGWKLRNETVVFSPDNMTWHVRSSRITNAASYIEEKPWRAQNIVRAYNKLIAFDNQDGRIGEVSRDFYDEYGEHIERTFDITPLRAGKPVFLPRVEISMQTGVGDSTTTDPKIELRTTRNGSEFSGGRVRSFGAEGKFNQRVVWRQLGRFTDYVGLRFSTAEKVQIAILGVSGEPVGGSFA